jgi:hypothetical protein
MRDDDVPLRGDQPRKEADVLKVARVRPSLTQEDMVARRQELLDAIKATIQAGRDGRPLSGEENQELDRDLDELKIKYQSWCRIENKIAPTLPDLKEQLCLLEGAMKRILDILGKPDTFIAALLVNNIDKDCPLLEPDQPMWTTDAPLTVRQIQMPYSGNPDEPDDHAESGRKVIRYEMTMDKDLAAIPPGSDGGELDFNLNRFEMSTEDDPVRCSIDVSNMRKAMVFNLTAFSSAIMRASRQVDRLDIYKQDDVYSGVTGGRDRLLVEACDGVLKKYSIGAKCPGPICLARLWSVVKPWIANELDDSDFSVKSKKIVKDYLAFCEAHREKEKNVNMAFLSEVCETGSYDVGSDLSSGLNDSVSSGSSCPSYSEAREDLASLASRRLRSPRKVISKSDTTSKLQSFYSLKSSPITGTSPIHSIISKSAQAMQVGGDTAPDVFSIDDFLKNDWGLEPLDE